MTQRQHITTAVLFFVVVCNACVSRAARPPERSDFRIADEKELNFVQGAAAAQFGGNHWVFQFVPWDEQRRDVGQHVLTVTIYDGSGKKIKTAGFSDANLGQTARYRRWSPRAFLSLDGTELNFIYRSGPRDQGETGAGYRYMGLSFTKPSDPTVFKTRRMHPAIPRNGSGFPAGQFAVVPARPYGHLIVHRLYNNVTKQNYVEMLLLRKDGSREGWNVSKWHTTKNKPSPLQVEGVRGSVDLVTGARNSAPQFHSWGKNSVNWGVTAATIQSAVHGDANDLESRLIRPLRVIVGVTLDSSALGKYVKDEWKIEGGVYPTNPTERFTDRTPSKWQNANWRQSRYVGFQFKEFRLKPQVTHTLVNKKKVTTVEISLDEEARGAVVDFPVHFFDETTLKTSLSMPASELRLFNSPDGRILAAYADIFNRAFIMSIHPDRYRRIGDAAAVKKNPRLAGRLFCMHRDGQSEDPIISSGNGGHHFPLAAKQASLNMWQGPVELSAGLEPSGGAVKTVSLWSWQKDRYHNALYAFKGVLGRVKFEENQPHRAKAVIVGVIEGPPPFPYQHIVADDSYDLDGYVASVQWGKTNEDSVESTLLHSSSMQLSNDLTLGPVSLGGAIGSGNSNASTQESRITGQVDVEAVADLDAGTGEDTSLSWRGVFKRLQDKQLKLDDLGECAPGVWRTNPIYPQGVLLVTSDLWSLNIYTWVDRQNQTLPGRAHFLQGKLINSNQSNPLKVLPYVINPKRRIPGCLSTYEVNKRFNESKGKGPIDKIAMEDAAIISDSDNHSYLTGSGSSGRIFGSWIGSGGLNSSFSAFSAEALQTSESNNDELSGGLSVGFPGVFSNETKLIASTSSSTTQLVRSGNTTGVKVELSIPSGPAYGAVYDRYEWQTYLLKSDHKWLEQLVSDLRETVRMDDRQLPAQWRKINTDLLKEISLTTGAPWKIMHTATEVKALVEVAVSRGVSGTMAKIAKLGSSETMALAEAAGVRQDTGYAEVEVPGRDALLKEIAEDSKVLEAFEDHVLRLEEMIQAASDRRISELLQSNAGETEPEAEDAASAR